MDVVDLCRFLMILGSLIVSAMPGAGWRTGKEGKAGGPAGPAGGVADSPRQLRGGAPGTNFGRSGELGQHRENPIQINLFGEF